jgi:hypothetical protein
MELPEAGRDIETPTDSVDRAYDKVIGLRRTAL